MLFKHYILVLCTVSAIWPMTAFAGDLPCQADQELISEIREKGLTQAIREWREDDHNRPINLCGADLTFHYRFIEINIDARSEKFDLRLKKGQDMVMAFGHLPAHFQYRNSLTTCLPPIKSESGTMSHLADFLQQRDRDPNLKGVLFKIQFSRGERVLRSLVNSCSFSNNQGKCSKVRYQGLQPVYASYWKKNSVIIFFDLSGLAKTIPTEKIGSVVNHFPFVYDNYVDDLLMFEGADLRQTRWGGRRLFAADFVATDLRGADLSCALINHMTIDNDTKISNTLVNLRQLGGVTLINDQINVVPKKSKIGGAHFIVSRIDK